MQLRVSDLEAITNRGDAIVEEEEVSVSVAIDSVANALVYGVAKAQALPNILLEERSVLNARKVNALGET